jgi:hypothetical protein
MRASHRELTREPSHLERSPGQQMTLRLAEVADGRLHAFDDLILIVDWMCLCENKQQDWGLGPTPFFRFFATEDGVVRDSTVRTL